MIDFIKKFFDAHPAGSDAGEGKRETRDARVAACALLIEMANIDNEFSEAERENIMTVLTGQFGLDEKDALEMTRVAQEALDASVDLWHFTNLINQNYTKQEKTEVVEIIWGLVYADGRLSDHERYLMHKLGQMLRFSHRELIDAKLRVLHARGDSS